MTSRSCFAHCKRSRPADSIASGFCHSLSIAIRSCVPSHAHAFAPCDGSIVLAFLFWICRCIKRETCVMWSRRHRPSCLPRRHPAPGVCQGVSEDATRPTATPLQTSGDGRRRQPRLPRAEVRTHLALWEAKESSGARAPTALHSVACHRAQRCLVQMPTALAMKRAMRREGSRTRTGMRSYLPMICHRMQCKRHLDAGSDCLFISCQRPCLAVCSSMQ
jgi:hypothetical protein